MFYISKKNWDKILGYAEEAYSEHKSEIGGMSVMVKDKDGDWELQQPVILKQQISSGNTVIDKDALAEYYVKQAQKMSKKEYRFCWWHSHHTMKAFWSGTDITAIEEYSDGDFSFALVVNLKGEYKFRVSVWNPVEAHEDVELEVTGSSSKCTPKMKKEVEELCNDKVKYSWSWKKAGSNYYKGYMSSDQRVEDERQERLPFHSTAGSMTSYGNTYSTLYSDMIDEIDELNSDMIEGVIDYKQYRKGIKALNKALKQKNSEYSVILLEENQIDTLLYTWPGQLVETENDKEIDQWNASFGLGANS